MAVNKRKTVNPTKEQHALAAANRYSEEAYAKVLDRIALGEPTGSICREKGMPGTDAFWSKLNRDPTYAARYARAKAAAMELMADETLRIADETKTCTDHVQVNAARLRVDTRKFLMAKLAPKRFGDKLEIDQTTTLQNMSEAEIYERLQQFADGEPYVQGLLDALTMLDEFKSRDLKGKTVTIVGDIKHSRVFGSLVRILTKLKAEIRVAAPETFLPDFVENFGIKTYWNVDEALVGADVIYALRVQEERGAKGDIPTLREYSKTFGISEKRLKLANKGAILMHAGPVMRDIDVHSALVARHPQSRILQQVENGSAIRKALLWLMADRVDGKVKAYTPL